MKKIGSYISYAPYNTAVRTQNTFFIKDTKEDYVRRAFTRYGNRTERTYYRFEYQNKLLLSYTRISHSKLDDSWEVVHFKIQWDELSQISQYEDNLGNCWKVEWGIQFPFDTLIQSAKYMQHHFSVWFQEKYHNYIKT